MAERPTVLKGGAPTASEGNPDRQEPYVFRLVQPHNPAFWLYALFLAVGIIYLLNELDNSFRSFPIAVVLAIVVWTLYSLPWFLVLFHEQLIDERPAKMAMVAFLWGGFIATFVMSIEANVAIWGLLSKLVSPQFSNEWGAAISAPLVEETAKGLGIVMLILLARPVFRRVQDGVIIGALVGLGFQVIEDLIYTINAANLTAAGDEFTPLAQMFFSRGIMNGLWSHAMYSGIVGGGIAYFTVRTDKTKTKRIGTMVGWLAIAWSLHFVWNSPSSLNGSTVLALTTAARFLSFPVIFILAVRWLMRQRRDEFGVVLRDEVEAGTVTADEAEMVTESYRRRKKHLRAVKRADGGHARKAARDLYRAERDLAKALARSTVDDSEAVDDARGVIVRLRSAGS